MNGAPSIAGTYTVLASFAGSTDYLTAVASTGFTIGQAAPALSVSDNTGMFSGTPFVASDSIAGVGSQSAPATSLESVSPSLTYYSGTGATGPALSDAPSGAGTYTVLASFAGSTDYTSGTRSTTFTISPAVPVILVSDAGGTYDGSAFAATAAVNGTSSLEGVAPALSYYSGATATGTPLAGAPSHAGTYTVAASFGGSADYSAAQSSPATFVISPAPLTIMANDQTMAYGDPLPALTASYSGFVGSDTLANLTVQPTLSTTATSTSPVTGSPYPITISGAVDPDYAISYVAGQLTVTSAVPPTSSVAALGYRTSNTSILVSWSGAPGSGGPIGSYNIYVSTNSGPFTIWQTNTSAMSADFTATVGDTYGFSSQATDAAGKTEAMHGRADTTVTVMAMAWHNSSNPLDVLGTGGAIVPADALAVIDYLNLHPGNSSLPPTAPAGSDYYDVLGQNSVVPADALAVIDFLNLHPTVDVVAAAVAPADVAAAETAQPAVVSNSASSTAVQTAAAMDAGLVGINFAASPSYGPPPLSPAVMAVSSLSVAPAANAALISDAELGTSSSTQPFLPSGAIPPSSELARLTTNQQVADSLFADPSWWEE